MTPCAMEWSTSIVGLRPGRSRRQSHLCWCVVLRDPVPQARGREFASARQGVRVCSPPRGANTKRRRFLGMPCAMEWSTSILVRRSTRPGTASAWSRICIGAPRRSGLFSTPRSQHQASPFLRNLFVVTHRLKKYLPDIYWMTVFGAPYVRLFSQELLLSAPAYQVQELENGS